MDQIKWCIQQKKGIEIVDKSTNLQEAYIIKAEEALDTLQTTKSRDWQFVAAYYTIYNSLYSLLMKIGIKCEIHTCTIGFATQMLANHFSSDDFTLIEKALNARIDSQYYVNRKVSDQNYDLIMKKTPQFLVTCKNIIITEKEIEKIRKEISSFK